MRMLRLILVAQFLVVIAGALTPAQTDAQLGPAAGERVIVLGQDGSEYAAITVSGIVDPYEPYDPNYPPERGYRVVVVSVTVENTGGNSLQLNPADFKLVDDSGFMAEGFYTLPLPDAGTVFMQSQEVAAGASVTGDLPFQVFSGATIETMLYRPQSDRATVLARFTTAIPGVGEAVSIVENDLSAPTIVTIDEIQDPFEGFDPSSAPQRGTRYVMLVVSVSNTGLRPARFDPSEIEILDTDGFLIDSGYVNRGEAPVPDLVYTDPLETDATVTGVLVYSMLAGTVPGSIVYRPDSDRFIEFSVTPGTPAAEDSGSGPAGAGSTEESSSGTVAATTGDPCAAFLEWNAGTVERFTETGTIAASLQPIEERVTADVPAIRQAAADIAQLAVAQQASAPPAEAASFNDLAATYLDGVSKALDFYADGLESGDVAIQVVALANLAEIEQAFLDGASADAAYDALLAQCQLD